MLSSVAKGRSTSEATLRQLMTRRKIQITVESNHLLILRQRKTITKAWCEACEMQVEMLMVRDNTELALTKWRDLVNQAEGRRVHVVPHNETGLTLVCLNSLMAEELQPGWVFSSRK